MSIIPEKLRKFAIKLFKIDAIKFGEYKTKVGLISPIYCDLRVIISYPDLLETLANLFAEKLNELECDIICGVPYTALPIATAISLKTNIPMVMKRKEAKDYGTKKLIEGNFKQGDNCIIIEDVVTSGSSVLETVKELSNSGILCTDVLVLLNREQGGAGNLKRNNINMHALLTMTELIDVLLEENYINEETHKKVVNYIKDTQVNFDVVKSNGRVEMSFEKRIKLAKNAATRDLFQIMIDKKTNLCVAADLVKSEAILNLAESIGSHICLLKLHVDIIEDYNEDFMKRLQEIARRCNFILFEDRKFSDIGKTVELQYTNGVYKISKWAKIITAHSLMGKGTLQAIKSCVNGLEDRGVFLLAEASTGGLITPEYTSKTVELGKEFPDIVTGFVCQSKLFLDRPEFIQLTPGVRLEDGKDNFDQNYNTPEKVIMEKGADVAVVGRGITTASNPCASAAKYKEVLWKLIEERTK